MNTNLMKFIFEFNPSQYLLPDKVVVQQTNTSNNELITLYQYLIDDFKIDPQNVNPNVIDNSQVNNLQISNIDYTLPENSHIFIVNRISKEVVQDLTIGQYDSVNDQYPITYTYTSTSAFSQDISNTGNYDMYILSKQLTTTLLQPSNNYQISVEQYLNGDRIGNTQTVVSVPDNFTPINVLYPNKEQYFKQIQMLFSNEDNVNMYVKYDPTLVKVTDSGITQISKIKEVLSQHNQEFASMSIDVLNNLYHTYNIKITDNGLTVDNIYSHYYLYLSSGNTTGNITPINLTTQSYILNMDLTYLLQNKRVDSNNQYVLYYGDYNINSQQDVYSQISTYDSEPISLQELVSPKQFSMYFTKEFKSLVGYNQHKSVASNECQKFSYNLFDYSVWVEHNYSTSYQKQGIKRLHLFNAIDDTDTICEYDKDNQEYYVNNHDIFFKGFMQLKRNDYFQVDFVTYMDSTYSKEYYWQIVENIKLPVSQDSSFIPVINQYITGGQLQLSYIDVDGNENILTYDDDFYYTNTYDNHHHIYYYEFYFKKQLLMQSFKLTYLMPSGETNYFSFALSSGSGSDYYNASIEYAPQMQYPLIYLELKDENDQYIKDSNGVDVDHYDVLQDTQNLYFDVDPQTGEVKLIKYFEDDISNQQIKNIIMHIKMYRSLSPSKYQSNSTIQKSLLYGSRIVIGKSTKSLVFSDLNNDINDSCIRDQDHVDSFYSFGLGVNNYDVNNPNIKLAFSIDKGLTWYAYNTTTSEWTHIYSVDETSPYDPNNLKQMQESIFTNGNDYKDIINDKTVSEYQGSMTLDEFRDILNESYRNDILNELISISPSSQLKNIDIAVQFESNLTVESVNQDELEQVQPVIANINYIQDAYILTQEDFELLIGENNDGTIDGIENPLGDTSRFFKMISNINAPDIQYHSDNLAYYIKYYREQDDGTVDWDQQWTQLINDSNTKSLLYISHSSFDDDTLQIKNPEDFKFKVKIDCKMYNSVPTISSLLLDYLPFKSDLKLVYPQIILPISGTQQEFIFEIPRSEQVNTGQVQFDIIFDDIDNNTYTYHIQTFDTSNLQDDDYFKNYDYIENNHYSMSGTGQLQDIYLVKKFNKITGSIPIDRYSFMTNIYRKDFVNYKENDMLHLYGIPMDGKTYVGMLITRIPEKVNKVTVKQYLWNGQKG